MKNKNRALKALFVLMAVLVICAFLARTVQTITTPKIKRIQPTYGKLEDRIQVKGEVYFKKGEEIFLAEAQGMNVVVDKLSVQHGYKVSKGDLLFTTKVGSYNEKLNELKNNINKVSREYTAEYAASIRLAKNSEQNELYQELLLANDDFFEKRFQAFFAAKNANYDLKGDVEDWGELPMTERQKRETAEKKLPPKEILGLDAPPAVKEKIDAAFASYVHKHEVEGKLRGIYNRSYGTRIPDMVFEHIKKLNGFQEQISKIEEELYKLEEKNKLLKEVKAPRDGYLIDFKLKAGDAIEGPKSIYALSQEGEVPLLRLDITDIKRNIKKGTRVRVDGLKDDLKIADVLLGEDNKKFAIISLEDAAISELGGMSKLIKSGVEATISYRADRATTLLPASALRNDSDGSYFVYTVESDYGGLMGNVQYVLKKMSVTVIEKTNSVVSVSEDLNYYSIADKEDRSIKEGQTVMDYVE